MVKEMKKTSLGLLPNDWDVDILEHRLKIQTGSRNTEDKQENGKYPFFVRSSKIEHIGTYHYDCEAILTAGDGVGTGKVFHYINGKFDAHQRVYILTEFEGIKGKYFYYYFRENFLNEVSKYTAKSSVDSVRRDMIAKMAVPIPKIEEQVAIAEALSDVDSLISSLQKLIEKKKAIKQGAMQELLTGRKRLPGFSGEWKHGVWKDVLTGFYSGATPYRGKADYYKGNIRWVSSGELNYNIITDTIEHISERAQSETSLTMHPAGTFLMAITGLEAAGTRGSCAILGKEATTNQSCMAIYGTDKMVIPYLYHYYLLNGERLAFQYCQGTKQQSYTAAIVKELPIYYPCDIAEQRAIAQVLSDMDSEIELLEKKLAKYQQIKQGMMQELLTGRIRLVDADVKKSPEAHMVREKQHQPTHNQHFDDAVMIAGIVNAFYSEKYPLGRKKVQKLLYLVRRKEQADISAFHKKAAGPYADEIRYKGGEPIAQKNKYIQVKRSEKGSRFEKGVQMQQALTYLQDWGKQADIDWLVSQFQYTSVNELELLATVDMAICDLRREGKETSVASIKDLIHSNKEWRDKLKKTYFRDSDIQRAIKKCEDLFES
ncbi:restriction endonuclease subunit S [Flavonifractor sp. An10]|uniref:restriction endonuclease subunit S n=1 Tax=Flavonifractor sp. An10 TaxID=1965537 RepID=UPI0019526C20|nr:restriction endonuclease subunit S [Flavonifractor sp. An10]